LWKDDHHIFLFISSNYKSGQSVVFWAAAVPEIADIRGVDKHASTRRPLATNLNWPSTRAWITALLLLSEALSRVFAI
jgi:hypothetical protein